MQVEPQNKIDEELPEDLAALAQQLQGEADALAECYPSGEIHPVLKEVLSAQLKEHDRTRQRRAKVVAAMAPLLILFGSAALLFVAQQNDRANMRLPHVSRSDTPRTNDGAAIESTPASLTKGDEEIITIPADGEWTGPELEGLIDIWDQDKTVVRRVSF